MTLLASCRLTYCLHLLRPDCPELFLTRSFSLSTTEKAKHFKIHVMACYGQKFDYISIETYKAFLTAIIVCFINLHQT